MIREKLILGHNIYNCEYYETSINDTSEKIYKNYVIIRNFNIDNNIAIDTDILFIEKNIYMELIENMNDLNISTYVLPILKTMQTYSKNLYEFNDIYTNTSFYKKDENGKHVTGDDVYMLYDQDGKPANILCDKIKIYHPIYNIDQNNNIVHIYNNINGVNFHYLCREYNTYKSESCEEIQIDNSVYSEYIEVYIPNIKYLFDEISENIYNVYYKEDITNIVSSNSNIDNLTYYNKFDKLVPLSLLIQPFRILETFDPVIEQTVYSKQYLKLNKSIENNYLTYPIHLTVYPYKYYDDKINLFILDDKLPSATVVFTNTYKFTVSSKLGFAGGILSINSMFNYPEKNKYLDLYKNTADALQHAYMYFNNVKADEYIKGSELYNQNFGNLDDIDKKEYIDSNDIPVDFLGFRIRIYNGLSTKKLIFSRNISIEFKDLDDFSFNLNGIFSNWYEMNEYPVVIITFVDNYLGKIISSNHIVITKEWFKYMITDNTLYTLKQLYTKNDEFIKDNMKTVDLKNGVNFINNITCILKKEDNTVKTSGNRNALPRILYKPIFYRINDLQKIIIRNNVKQNIGINLAEYMTKIDSFKIVIDKVEYIEIGRNDIYVIFAVDALSIQSKSGIYDIISADDDTYISSGRYEKI